MVAIVLQLQRDALDSKVRVSDLLRKDLVVARKLGLAEFRSWVESELNGYQPRADIPDYRELIGQVRGYNPCTGVWMPLVFEDPKMGEKVSKSRAKQPLPELEHLVESSAGRTFHMPFSHALQKELSKGFGFQTQVSLFSDKAALIGLIDAVRNIVLNWSLKLEEDGILGEEISFTEKEREVASRTPQNITNYYGPVHGQQIQQGNETAKQVQINAQLDASALQQFIESLVEQMSTLGLKTDAEAELRAEFGLSNLSLNLPSQRQEYCRRACDPFALCLRAPLAVQQARFWSTSASFFYCEREG